LSCLNLIYQILLERAMRLFSSYFIAFVLMIICAVSGMTAARYMPDEHASGFQRSKNTANAQSASEFVALMQPAALSYGCSANGIKAKHPSLASDKTAANCASTNSLLVSR